MITSTSRRLQRQYSTSKPEQSEFGQCYATQLMQQQSTSSRKNYPSHISRSYDLSARQPSVVGSGNHSRHNSFPTRQSRAAAAEKSLLRPAHLALQRTRPFKSRPPPLNLTAALWDSGQTSETDCSVASSSSPPRSASAASSPLASSPSTSPRLFARQAASSSSPPPPRLSPRDLNKPPRSAGLYFSLPPLSPIPHSPSVAPAVSCLRRTSSPYWKERQQQPSPVLPPSPRSPSAGRRPSSSPVAAAVATSSSGNCGSPAGVGYAGNLARLASRRRSNAVSGMRRRTSNFLELPETDYERQRRYCSLPEHGYNPRHANEIYKLRAFSISPKGALIKHGDLLASRKPRSSAGSTANNSRQASRTPSRGASPYASNSGSRDVSPMARSPMAKSPVEGGCGGVGSGGGGSAGLQGRSPWSSQKSGLEDPVEDQSRSTQDDDEEEEEAEEEDEEEDGIKYRVCILGQNACGKTALVNQVLTSEYMNTYDASLDEDFGERSVSVVLDGEESELVFIDHTNGEMSVENTLSTYDPHACIIVYSVVDRLSFQVAEDILGYLWRVSYSEGGKASVILVGNKVDLERSRVIQQEEGKKLAMSFGAKFIETSAGLQHNVDELLVGVLKQIRLRLQLSSPPPPSSFSHHSTQQPLQQQTSHRSAVSSPLHTLQVARDILARVCLSAGKQPSLTKSCENMHVL